MILWFVVLPMRLPLSRSYTYMSSYSVPLLCPSMRFRSSWTSDAMSRPNTLSTFLLYDLPLTLPMSTTAILSASLLAAAVLKCCSFSMTSRSTACCSARAIPAKSRAVLPRLLSSSLIASRTRAALMFGLAAARSAAGVSMNPFRVRPLDFGSASWRFAP